MTVERKDDLHSLVERYKNLGEKDPRVICGKVVAALGDQLLAAMQPYVEDYITEVARQRLSSERRQEVARITAKGLKSPEIMLKSIWIPSEGGSIVYKKIAEATADDFDARAAYLERLVAGIWRHSTWCRDCAEAIRRAKVRTAGELESLPALPEEMRALAS